MKNIYKHTFVLILTRAGDVCVGDRLSVGENGIVTHVVNHEGCLYFKCQRDTTIMAPYPQEFVWVWYRRKKGVSCTITYNH